MARKDKPREAKLPSAWKVDARADGPKTWSDGARADDPDKRVVHAPTASGIGDGKSFHFLFGLKLHSPRDREFLAKEREQIVDDIAALRGAGYTVVVDTEATRQDFLDMLSAGAETGGPPAGFFWSAHGNEDGSVECCDGATLRPEHLLAIEVPGELRLAIFASCYSGCRSRTWRDALGGHALVVGWGRPVTIDRTVEFLQERAETETDLDDLLRRYILSDTPLPGDFDQEDELHRAASEDGRIGDLASRIEELCARLGARFHEEDKHFLIDVPLEANRHHVAKLFVVDSAQPHAEGEPLVGVEADVGEITQVVDLTTVLAPLPVAGYACPQLVRSHTDMPRLIVQAFLPMASIRGHDLATLVYQASSYADALEARIFGGDRR